MMTGEYFAALLYQSPGQDDFLKIMKEKKIFYATSTVK